MYGSGWVAAKDRGLLLKLGLGPAYTAALSVPGVNAFGLLLEQRARSNRAPKRSPTSKARRKCSKKRALAGAQVIEDLENWVDGVNAYEARSPARIGCRT